MSYNIDSVEALVLDARMTAKDIKKCMREKQDELPEACFLEYAVVYADKALEMGEPDREISIGRRFGKRPKDLYFDWQGEGSGHAYDLLKEFIAPMIRGRAELVFTWEGGDSLTGLIIEDGKVTECDVVQTLRPKKTKV